MMTIVGRNVVQCAETFKQGLKDALCVCKLYQFLNAVHMEYHHTKQELVSGIFIIMGNSYVAATFFQNLLHQLYIMQFCF
jgi:hypothetical protein